MPIGENGRGRGAVRKAALRYLPPAGLSRPRPDAAHRGTREDYLIHAMIGYRDGTRHGTDTNMNAVMYGVTDEQVATLAYFMARQK